MLFQIILAFALLLVLTFQMTLKSQVVQADAVGTTTGSPERVGVITLPKDTTNVHAIMLQAVSSAVMTTAEALLGTFLIDSADLGIQNWERNSGLNLGGGPSTNMAPIASPLVIVPLDINSSKGGSSLDSLQITFDFEVSAPEPTSDVAAQAFIVSSDAGGIGPNALEALWKYAGNWGRYPFVTDNWYTANDDEIGDATAEQMDDTINVEAKYSKITAMETQITPDAVSTDDEQILAYVEIESGVSGVQKQHQQWPMVAVNPEEGTAVGAPNQWPTVMLPLWIDKGNTQQAFNFTINFQATTSGANAVNLSLGVNK